MNAADIATIFKLYSFLKQNKPQIIDDVELKLSRSIETKTISDLSSIECGLIYLHKPRQYTTAVSMICEEHLNKFKSDQFGNVFMSDNSNFMHSELYNLIFPNLYSPYFEYIIKDIFKKYDTKLLKPMQEKVYLYNIYQQENFLELKAIEKFKRYPSNFGFTYEIFRMSEKYQMDPDESSILKILLQDLLFKHNLYHKTVENKLIKLTSIQFNPNKSMAHFNILPKEEEEIKYDFLFAPVKGFERSFIKLKESIGVNTKFPLYTLKDLTRASIVFRNCKDLVKFFHRFKSNIEESTDFEIYEVKNMFKNDEDYNYKDVKMILGFKVNSGLTLLVEIQLILYDILVMKKTMHKFYDVMRADFTLHREELFNMLSSKLEIDNDLGKDVKWGANNLMYPLYIQGIIALYYLQDKFKIGKELSYEKKESKDAGFMHYRHVEVDGHKFSTEYYEKQQYMEYLMYPYGTDNQEKTFNIGINLNENGDWKQDMVSFQYYMMRKDGDKPELIYRKNGCLLSTNLIALVFNASDYGIQWNRLINFYNKDTGFPLGSNFVLAKELKYVAKSYIIYDIETSEFHGMMYNIEQKKYFKQNSDQLVTMDEFDWSLYYEDYIPDFDLTVFIPKELKESYQEDYN